MTIADWPRDDPRREKLLAVRAGDGALEDLTVGDLPSLVGPGDLLVLNDAGTLPGSLRGHSAGGAAVELRLAAVLDPSAAHGANGFLAAAFGAGDFTTRTEHRPPPPALRPGDVVHFDQGLEAQVVEVSPRFSRLLTVRFNRTGAALWSALFAVGRPVQYAHVKAPLPLWQVQTSYAARPWSAEEPSAGRPLELGLLLELRGRGVALATLTHGCGLSSTGDPELDAALPLPERYEIPPATVDAVAGAARVIAVGTSVVRALEGSAQAHGGVLTAGAGVTDLKLGPGFTTRVVDGVLTGLHERGTSHFELLRVFASAQVLDAAWAHAEAHGYLAHEFGDSSLLLP